MSRVRPGSTKIVDAAADYEWARQPTIYNDDIDTSRLQWNMGWLTREGNRMPININHKSPVPKLVGCLNKYAKEVHSLVGRREPEKEYIFLLRCIQIIEWIRARRAVDIDDVTLRAAHALMSVSIKRAEASAARLDQAYDKRTKELERNRPAAAKQRALEEAEEEVETRKANNFMHKLEMRFGGPWLTVDDLNRLLTDGEYTKLKLLFVYVIPARHDGTSAVDPAVAMMGQTVARQKWSRSMKEFDDVPTEWTAQRIFMPQFPPDRQRWKCVSIDADRMMATPTMRQVQTMLPRNEADTIGKYKQFHLIVLVNVMSRKDDSAQQEGRNHLRVARSVFDEYSNDGPMMFDDVPFLPLMLDGGLHEWRRKFHVYMSSATKMKEQMARQYGKTASNNIGRLATDKIGSSIIPSLPLDAYTPTTAVGPAAEQIRIANDRDFIDRYGHKEEGLLRDVRLDNFPPLPLQPVDMDEPMPIEAPCTMYPSLAALKDKIQSTKTKQVDQSDERMFSQAPAPIIDRTTKPRPVVAAAVESNDSFVTASSVTPTVDEDDKPSIDRSTKPTTAESTVDKYLTAAANASERQSEIGEELAKMDVKIADAANLMNNARGTAPVPPTTSPSDSVAVPSSSTAVRAPGGGSTKSSADAFVPTVDRRKKPDAVLPKMWNDDETLQRMVNGELGGMIQKAIYNLTQCSKGKPPMRDAHFIGLVNEKNWCFANSTIQMLLSLPSFTDFYSNTIRTMRCINQANYSTDSTQGLLTVVFREIVDKLVLNVQHAKTDIHWFIEYMARQTNTEFADRKQHDAQEFCHRLIDALHEDVNRVSKPVARRPSFECNLANGKELQKYAAAQYQCVESFSSSPVYDRMRGLYISQVMCLHCKHVSNTFDSFLQLTLELRQTADDTMTLEDCLDDHFRDEEMPIASHHWRCSTCKTERDAVKRMRMWRVPQILLCHFKRFNYLSTVATKNRIAVNYPRALGVDADALANLSKYVHVDAPIVRLASGQPAKQYDLHAITMHDGSLSHGHYTTEALRDGRWINFNDEKVTAVGQSGHSSAANAHRAYMLAYELVG